jgi:hypothetical protein
MGSAAVREGEGEVLDFGVIHMCLDGCPHHGHSVADEWPRGVEHDLRSAHQRYQSLMVADVDLDRLSSQRLRQPLRRLEIAVGDEEALEIAPAGELANRLGAHAAGAAKHQSGGLACRHRCQPQPPAQSFGWPAALRSRSRWRSSTRRILPLIVFGSSAVNSISRGYL